LPFIGKKLQSSKGTENFTQLTLLPQMGCKDLDMTGQAEDIGGKDDLHDMLRGCRDRLSLTL